MSSRTERREKWLSEELGLMTNVIRVVGVEDAAACADIYAPIVLKTHTSFEMEPPDQAEMAGRISATLPDYPWLVYCANDEVLGYAYASRHKVRLAYQWSVDASVYVRPGSKRQGIGRALYKALFDTLRLQGIFTVFAGVALPNEASIGLHLATGFDPVGVYRAAGYKFGKWHDVAWYQLPLRELVSEPQAPIPFRKLRTLDAFLEILRESAEVAPR